MTSNSFCIIPGCCNISGDGGPCSLCKNGLEEIAPQCKIEGCKLGCSIKKNRSTKEIYSEYCKKHLAAALNPEPSYRNLKKHKIIRK